MRHAGFKAARIREPDGAPIFDHVATIVADLDATLAFYRDRLTYPVIGKLVHSQDRRGFVIHYLQAGPAALGRAVNDATQNAGPRSARSH